MSSWIHKQTRLSNNLMSASYIETASIMSWVCCLFWLSKCLSRFVKSDVSNIFNWACYLLLGTTGTIFITVLLWRGPWLEIEPGTFRTRCQHNLKLESSIVLSIDLSLTMNSRPVKLHFTSIKIIITCACIS